MAETRWLDVTRAVYPGMPVWPGDPPVRAVPVSRIEDGQESNVTLWAMSSHVGTHVDPPRHFERDGGGVETMAPDVLCGPAWLADFSPLEDHVTAADLDAIVPAGVERLLVRTRNSDADPTVFHESFLALAPDAAAWVVERGIRLIGVDGPSVEAFGVPEFVVHHTLLRAGVAVVEGLSLAAVPAGAFEMVCAPLLFRNGDGAPARVFLRASG